MGKPWVRKTDQKFRTLLSGLEEELNKTWERNSLLRTEHQKCRIYKGTKTPHINQRCPFWKKKVIKRQKMWIIRVRRDKSITGRR